ncbi:MAG: hypothetical protein ABRQ39_18935 [Candidatus Eremiobacterota bacterium]
MQNTLHIKTNVLPGNKIEIISPDLLEGNDVELLIFQRLPGIHKKSIMDIIKSKKRPGLFNSAEEIDEYLQKERNS